ncbi:hypothetical protein PLEOSDRAFT_1088804 [Pleurotus ostreatus PC15]|uniref:Uncharacterized protein n=1 Tax=Pleurotus ostreatus (strain PC15) TaxID=1137138 RepID=A0A067P528_PLEO1|nr:hypothetical protein PLEOSDRAFT_1088804 [Pleurotus ostreatus PC15]
MQNRFQVPVSAKAKRGRGPASRVTPIAVEGIEGIKQRWVVGRGTPTPTPSTETKTKTPLASENVVGHSMKWLGVFSFAPSRLLQIHTLTCASSRVPSSQFTRPMSRAPWTIQPYMHLENTID